MIDPRNISCLLITKDPVYPWAILDRLARFGFGELRYITSSDSQGRKQELFAQARCEYIFYCDDDCLPPVEQILEAAEPGRITCAMKETHITAYANGRIALIGWGAIFPKSMIKSLDIYRTKYGEDHIYWREDTRIMTWMNYPQKRLSFKACAPGQCTLIEPHIHDLPSAWAADRLWRQPEHNKNIQIVLERCAELVRSHPQGRDV